MRREVIGRFSVARPVVAVVLAAGLVFPVGAARSHEAGAVVHNCDRRAQVQLHIASAEHLHGISAPAVRQVARQLTAAKSVCDARARAWVGSQLARISRSQGPAQVHRQIAAVLAWIRGHPSRRGQRSAAAASGTLPCALDRTIHVHLKDAQQVADYIATAERAQALGDDSDAAAALAGAQDAYGSWATGATASATSIGDLVTIATGALSLGLDRVADTALKHAQRLAAEHYRKIRAEIDPCHPTKHDLDCQARAATAVMLLGAEALVGGAASLSASLVELQRAVAHGKPAKCREWAFTAQLTSNDPEFHWSEGIQWKQSRFRIDQTKKRVMPLNGNNRWPLHIDNASGYCKITTPSGTSTYPASITGGSFHYSVSGKLEHGGLLVMMTSKDARVKITTSGPEECQGLVPLGERLLDAYLRKDGVWFRRFSPGQRSAKYHLVANGFVFDAEIHVVS